MKMLALPERVLSLGTYVVVKPIEAEKAEGACQSSCRASAAAGPKDRAKTRNQGEGARNEGTTEGHRKMKRGNALSEQAGNGL